MDKKIKGSCLCQKVSYQYEGPEFVFQYCHCSRCRKFTGSAYAANIIVDPAQFEWTSGEHLLGRFEHPDAKHFATCFCTKCGSSLPWLAQSKRSIVIPAGTLDDDPGIRPKHNIFWHDRAPWRSAVEDMVNYEALPTK